MKVERFDTDGIDIGERLRPLTTTRVTALASSIREIGLRTPLTVIVRPVGDDTKVILVTGHHRLAALRQLGEERVDCIVIADDEIDAKLWEIDENLIRASLSPTEEAEHMKLRKELWAAREAGSGKSFSVTSPKGGRPKQFASDVAEKTGRTKQSVNQKIARAEAICAEAMTLIKGSRLDKGVYLDGLKSLSHDEQVEKVRRDLAEGSPQAPKSVPAASIATKRPQPAPSEAFVRFLSLAADIGKLAPNDIVAGIPAANRRADLRGHVRSLMAMLEAVDEIMEARS